MARGKYLSLEEARKQDRLERFCKEHPSDGIEAVFDLLLDAFDADKIGDMTATDPATVRRIYRKFSPDYLTDAAEALDAMTGGISLRLHRAHKPRKHRERIAKTPPKPAR